MPVVNVVDQNGEKVSQVELPEELFNVKVKPAVLHEVVTMQLASRRSGTASVKNRSDIRGSRRKLFRQKGTGRARRGDIKSPLLRGGGVVFGPKPRSFAYKVPKRVRKLALKMALTSKLKENKLVVLKDFGLKEVKTKGFLQVLSALNLGSTLIVEDRKDETLELSSRNIPYVKVLRAEGLNTYDILKYESLLLLEPVIQTLEGRLSA
ncbi:MAG: 50S ribosomal protein L4 [Deltaproteobacteria bacterium]|nr:50S ribosomal protein L4 [Deltaproteobacteria bacterium]MBW1995635.1 50S ribosomal protein L4 [Deltaproteobacteria bacterium]MBW2151094.1 50S ribosomal protein L4 [Deltaproteobacteria bacterium]